MKLRAYDGIRRQIVTYHMVGSLSHIDGWQIRDHELRRSPRHLEGPYAGLGYQLRWDRQASWDSLAYGIQEVERISRSVRQCFVEHSHLSMSHGSQSLVRLTFWKFLGRHAKFVQSKCCTVPLTHLPAFIVPHQTHHVHRKYYCT